MIAGCQAFVSVSEQGSFTLAAAALRLPQSVVSRRVAALEKHLGSALLERSSRRVALTPFGADLLPSAKRLLLLAEALHHDAERARRRPFGLAVPEICSTASLARLEVEARREGVFLDLTLAAGPERTELVRSLGVRAALLAVPPDQSTWSVPLGLGQAGEPTAKVIHLESLRPGRAQATARGRVVWVQPEDDVPHVRDRLTRTRDSLALRPSQVSVAAALTTAVAEVLGSDDLLLCSRAQASELGLAWRPIGEIQLNRGFDVAAPAATDAERLRNCLWLPIARCLGAEENR